ncbi:21859_t:CDS:2, partial [Gigaspora rosea]
LSPLLESSEQDNKEAFSNGDKKNRKHYERRPSIVLSSNTCLKCKKIVCRDCLTKKSIDLSLLPKEFVSEILSNFPKHKGNNNKWFNITKCIRLCDFCCL